MRRNYILIPLLIAFISCKAQTNDLSDIDNAFSKVFPKQAYLDDLNELATTLTTTHPHPYEFTSEIEFWQTVEEVKNKINDSTTFSEFLWHCSAIISNIGCSHTSLGYFNQEDKILPIELRFPIEAKLIDDRLYVSDPLVNKNIVESEIEVYSINGVPVDAIKTNVFKHIASQGKNTSYKRLLFNGYFTSYIPNALGFPEKYEIVVKGKEQPIKLTRLKEYQYKPRINATNECQDRLCLNYSKGKNIPIVTIRSFSYYGAERLKIFKSFIDNSFEEINAKKAKSLIIDLRMNSGGSGDASIHLLQYLAKQPFTYLAQEADGTDFKNEVSPFSLAFKGKLYVLIDGEGTSTTGHFLSLVKQKKMATLIGEEAGSNFICTANQKRGVALSNTGITYSVARNTYFTTAQNFPKDRGILPDHNIVQSVQDFLNNRDTVLNYTLELINNE